MLVLEDQTDLTASGLRVAKLACFIRRVALYQSDTPCITAGSQLIRLPMHASGYITCHPGDGMLVLEDQTDPAVSWLWVVELACFIRRVALYQS